MRASRSSRRPRFAIAAVVSIGLGLWLRAFAAPAAVAPDAGPNPATPDTGPATAAAPDAGPSPAIPDTGPATAAAPDAGPAALPSAARPQPAAEDASGRNKAGDALRRPPKALVFPKVEGRPRVYVASVEDVIDLGLAPFLQRAIAAAEADPQTALLVLDMDTPGGRVDAALQIKDALLAARVKTLTFVDRKALSAGALIAYATDYIVMTDGATMGAATPIALGGPTGGETEAVDEKMVSAFRNIMRATAEAKGRNGDIAAAMVDKDLGVAGIEKPGKLVTLTQRQALDFGVADLAANALPELLDKAQLSNADVVRLEINWAERVARALTHPVVSSLLMSLGFLGLLIELYKPGFGITGILGILCLLLFFAGHLVVNLAGWESLLLFFAGLALLGVELFVLPGFGILGVLGVAAIVGSLIWTLAGRDLGLALDTGALWDGVVQVVLSLLVTLGAGLFVVRFLPRSRFGRRLVLATSAPAGGAALVEALHAPAGEPAHVAPGDRGVALTDLRPVGRAAIAGARLDVVTRGDYILRGRPIEVTATEGIRVVVRELAAATPEAEADTGRKP